MRISPVFAQANRSNYASMGRAFSNMDCRKPKLSDTRKSYDDVFFKLAEASMRDKKIELELQSMGLI